MNLKGIDARPHAPGSWRFAPWAALASALSGELAHHQVLSDMLRYDCRLGDARTFVLAAIVVLAWMALGTIISWRSVRGDAGTSNRRFIVHLGMLVAALMAVGVAWQTFAGFIVPACPT